MVPGDEAVADLMRRVLDEIVAVFEDAGATLPERRYIAVGPQAHDCAQVTVSFMQMYLGLPGQQQETLQRCDVPRSVVLSIQIARPIPAPAARASTPRAADISTMTETQTRDAWLLMDAALGPIHAFGFGALADVGMTPPQGGYQAIVLNLITTVP
jgi:hypothetical protein